MDLQWNVSVIELSVSRRMTVMEQTLIQRLQSVFLRRCGRRSLPAGAKGRSGCRLWSTALCRKIQRTQNYLDDCASAVSPRLPLSCSLCISCWVWSEQGWKIHGRWPNPNSKSTGEIFTWLWLDLLAFFPNMTVWNNINVFEDSVCQEVIPVGRAGKLVEIHVA